MWNWASRKEASNLVSSKHIKSIGAFLKTSLNWVILFFMLLILRYPMMGLLVYNFLKFISSSTSRLWLVFLALLLVWLATLSRCFLKFALKKYVLFTMGWKNILLCEKLFGDIRESWSHDSDDSFFGRSSSSSYHYFRIPSIKFLSSCRTPLLFKCNPLPFRWLLLIFHFQSCRLAIYEDEIEYLLFSLQGALNQFSWFDEILLHVLLVTALP